MRKKKIRGRGSEAEQRLGGAGGEGEGSGMTVHGGGVSFAGDENIWELDRGKARIMP